MARVDSGSTLILLIIGIVVISVVVIGFINRADPITQALDDDGNLHILVTLEEDGALLSAQLLIYNVKNKRAALLDLPVYLGVIIDEDDSLDRIDRLYNAGFFEEYRTEIENFAQTQIDFLIQFPLSRMEQLVDLLSGIRLFVLEDLSNDQRLPSGDVVYDGRKALEYISTYASLNDEVKKTEGLQAFLTRLLLTIADQVKYITHRDVVRYFASYVRTDLGQRDFKNFLLRFNSVEDGLVSTWTTQGSIRSVLVGNQRKPLLFLDDKWLETTVNQITLLVASKEDAQVENRGVRIEILNATAVSGLARRTKLLFEQYGYEVVVIGNYEDTDLESTLILNRSQTSNHAPGIAEIINATNLANQPLIENPEAIDVTVVLGNDFDGIIVQ